MPEIPTDSSAIQRAARLLEQGRLVAFPTETVYGLGADAENSDAVAAIYAAKGRPATHPVIVHVAPGADLGYWASSVPRQARQLIAAFWPGPLTLILKRAAHIPDAVSGGQDTIGLRCPAHPVAQALLREFKNGKGGLAAPSANKFGHVSPTTAAHVLAEFGSAAQSALACVLDGGQSAVGIESTILDLSRVDEHGAVLLRPGQISAEQIAEIIGSAPRAPDLAAPRASGTLESHYAPRTPLALIGADELDKLLGKLRQAGRRAALLHYSSEPVPGVPDQLQLPADADGYAHGLYAGLRELDAAGSDVILVVAPAASAEWSGINDRLRRAAHDSLGVLQGLLN